MGKLTNFVSESFIWGVGITRPRKGQENRAAIYITTILVLSVVGAVVMFLLLKDHLLSGIGH